MKLAKRHVFPSGLVLLQETSRALPVVDLELCFRTGSALDPEGLEGLTRMGWRCWRMGTHDLQHRAVEEAIASLGARLSVEVSSSMVRLRGVVIRRNLEPFLELLAKMLQEPAFRRADIAFAKREALADQVAMRDSDRAMVARGFRKHLFGDHVYARMPMGTAQSLRRLRRDAMVAHWQQQLIGQNGVFGISGDLSFGEAKKLAERAFGFLKKGKKPKLSLPSPVLRPGRRVLLLHRPGRPQSHMLIGTLGSRASDKDHDALSVANVAFGGTMASPLWQQVREQRGWSYGVSSTLGSDRQREAWRMHTVPEAGNAAECAALQLDLYEQWVKEGIDEDNHRLAKQNMIHSQCFDWDTAHKRLEQQIDAEALPFPVEQLKKAKQRIQQVTQQASNRALRKRLSSDDVSIVLLGDRKQLEADFGKLSGVTECKVVRYDRV